MTNLGMREKRNSCQGLKMSVYSTKKIFRLQEIIKLCIFLDLESKFSTMVVNDRRLIDESGKSAQFWEYGPAEPQTKWISSSRQRSDKLVYLINSALWVSVECLLEYCLAAFRFQKSKKRKKVKNNSGKSGNILYPFFEHIRVF